MILRDPVHGLVAFETEEEGIVPRLMDTPEVQRLRRVRQLGVTSIAFPGAEHTRFAHAVGAGFVMKLLLARLRAIQSDLPFWQQVTSERAEEALAAALLHDVGHGPLSHLFEDAIPGVPHHEQWTERIVLDPSTGVHKVLAETDPGLPARVAALVRGENALPYLAKAVSGTFDVDRCDYLLRDAHSTGVRYGIFDLDWLLRSLRFSPVTGSREVPSLAIDGAKGLPAIEAFILARLFMFQQIYLHKATRAAEWMIRAVLARAAARVADGERLPSMPRAIEHAAHGVDIELADYLELDDHVLWSAMHAWEGARDPALADVARRIRGRHLFKTLELFGENASEEGRARALAVAREVAVARGKDPEMHVGLDVATDTPFDTESEPLVVYAKGPARPLSEVSFLLGRLAGQVLSRVRLVFAAELREDLVTALGPMVGALLVLLVPAPAWAAEAGRDDDGTYARIDGDLGVSAGVGATVASGGPRLTGDLRFRYLDTIGIFATYEDGPTISSSADPRRVFAGGLEVRPLFLARWLRGWQTGVARVDLAIDSIGLELGAFFQQPVGVNAFESRPGLQLGMGLEIPVFTRASGPWIGVHGGGRWADAALGQGRTATPLQSGGYLGLTLAWHQVFGAHVVDAGDARVR